MKFSCEKAVLSEAISTCIHAVSTKSTIAVLEGLLISVGTSQVTMCGYNFKTGIRKTFSANIAEKGDIVLSAKILSDIVRKLPDDLIEISADDHFMTTIHCGLSEFNILGASAEEFPELPDVVKQNGISLPCSTLKNMIANTVFAVSDNENKPIHTGSLFEVAAKELTVVSVDGYRLALAREAVECSEKQTLNFVVPGETLKEINRILPESDDQMVAIYPERKHALFEIEDTLITTRLLEGEFLNYRNAIPEDNPIHLTIDVKNIIDCVERVSLIISERLKNPVRCCFEEESLKISCTTTLGRAYDECRISPCPEKIEIGFNNRYLLDALRACPEDQVLLELKSSLSPCVIRPLEGNKFLYLVLPVRLKAE
ncbi:DNA polymerase III subunit beta [Acidaminobacterium chupaoyuni]